MTLSISCKGMRKRVIQGSLWPTTSKSQYSIFISNITTKFSNLLEEKNYANLAFHTDVLRALSLVHGKVTSMRNIDCEQSLFSFRFSESSARAGGAKTREA